MPSSLETRLPQPSSRDTQGRSDALSIGVQTSDPLAGRSLVTWTAGDFYRIAVSYASGAAEFVGRLNVQPGERVLDVACGTGNLAIPAARAGASVIGLDIAPNLLAKARELATAEGLDLQLDEGNAEALPYGDGQFDTVISMFGVMFVPRPELAVAELVRVTRPGGRIALANWAPDGFVGEMLKLHTKAAPPPADVPSPLLWGDEGVVRERFAKHGVSVQSLTTTRRSIAMEYPTTPAGVVELFRGYYGPTVKTFERLEPDARVALRRDLERLWHERNTLAGPATRIFSDYLEVFVRIAA